MVREVPMIGTTARRTLATISSTAVLIVMLSGAAGGCGASNDSSDSGGGSSSSSGGSSSGGATVVPAPSAGHGRCETNLGVTVESGRVVGAVVYTCNGAAVLTLNVYLERQQTDGSFDPVISHRGLNSVETPSPFTLSVPCVPGTWQVRIVGSEDGLGASIRVDSRSGGVHVTC